MKSNLSAAIRLTLVCAVFFCGVYTLIVLGFARLGPNGGKGAVIIQQDKKYYSQIAQKFTDNKYFQSRPSAVGYNAAAAGGSNKGPSNPEYLSILESRIDSFMIHNPGIDKSRIPSDLMTASGSGLDPDISVYAAQVQVKRIAVARGISEDALMRLVQKHTEKPLAGLFGPEKINVLKLNIALDHLK